MDGINQILHTVKNVRRRLEKSEVERELVYAIAANSTSVVVDMDSELIEIVTRPVEDLFGYIDGEMIGQEIHILVPPDQREIHRQHFAEYRNRPNVRRMGTQSMSLMGYHKDGHSFPVEIGLVPLVREGRRLVIATILPGMAGSHSRQNGISETGPFPTVKKEK